MSGHEISLVEDTDGNVTGIELRVMDDDGTERSVTFEPDDNGEIAIEGRGPDGKKRGRMDPSGNGDHPLGK